MTVSSGTQSCWLVAFDFDHTVVDGNTDTHVIKAAPSGTLPPHVKASYVAGRWCAHACCPAVRSNKPVPVTTAKHT
jgi:4'-phosphopantetheinyl transferase EntD